MLNRNAAMRECAESHRQHGDKTGARAIDVAMISPRAARSHFPAHVAAIDNALAYAASFRG